MEEIKKDNIFKRSANKIWKKIDKDDVLTPAQKLAFDIFKICLYDENNIRYLNSRNSFKKYIVTKRYVTDKDISTFILLEERKLTIVNHQYRYDIDMPQKTSNIMSEMFNEKVEEERQNMEKEILSNITQSLEIVLSQFKEKLENSK